MSGHLNSFVYTVCLKGVDYMTKTKSIILCLVILIAIFSGCSTQETNSKSEVQANTINAITNEITAEQETSESETTTQKSDNSETTVANKARPAEQKSTGRTTTKKSTATQKQTTTKRQTTTKKVTTTQKPATTKKVTTTKKPITTKGAPTKHTHTMPCGNVGKWYSSKDAFMSDYYAEADYWNNKLDNDEISYEEYISKVPRGHEVWQCSCGKWTGNYKYK